MYLEQVRIARSMNKSANVLTSKTQELAASSEVNSFMAREGGREREGERERGRGRARGKERETERETERFMHARSRTCYALVYFTIMLLLLTFSCTRGSGYGCRVGALRRRGDPLNAKGR